jgi:hypothetical protein
MAARTLRSPSGLCGCFQFFASATLNWLSSFCFGGKAPRSYEIAFLFEKSPTATASRFGLAFETFNRATMTAGIFARRPRRLTRLNVWNCGGIDEIL